jgi:hypothetical protein
VCGVCGAPVVRSEKDPPEDGTANGHEYEGGRLIRVRCKHHEPRLDDDLTCV